MSISLRTRAVTSKYERKTNFDVIDDGVDTILWAATELTVTILTATIPTLRPLYRRIRGSLSSGPYGSSRARGYELSDRPSNGTRHIERKAAVTASGEHKDDDRSDKHILKYSNGIRRTDTVLIDVEGAESWNFASKNREEIF